MRLIFNIVTKEILTQVSIKQINEHKLYRGRYTDNTIQTLDTMHGCKSDARM